MIKKKVQSDTFHAPVAPPNLPHTPQLHSPKEPSAQTGQVVPSYKNLTQFLPVSTLRSLSKRSLRSSVYKQRPTFPQQKKRRKTRGRRLRRWFVVCSLLLVLGVLLLGQGNGEAGAWFADTSRAILGPTITAQIEAWYLAGTDLFQQMTYHASGQSVTAPWAIAPTLTGRTAPNSPRAMALTPISPIIGPALAGEGTWLTQEMAPIPYNFFPLIAKTFLRPDPSHPYAIATLLQFDSRFATLHMVAGSREPGGPRGLSGPGRIPATDQNGNALLAAFNGGFKYADGQYGMMADGIVYVPPQAGAATLAVTREGQIILGAWGVDTRLNKENTDLIAWRQNASLLIDHKTINPLTHDGAAWGGTILNSSYTWRSGIGLTAQGTLIYAAGNALTAATLATALKAAGAVMALQTDINPFWVRAFLYTRNAQGALTITKLHPNMQGRGTEYLNSTTRDFFYLTRVVPLSLPPLSKP